MSVQLEETTGQKAETAAQPIPFSLCSTTRPVLPVGPLTHVPGLPSLRFRYLCLPFISFSFSSLPEWRRRCLSLLNLSFSFFPCVFPKKTFLGVVRTCLSQDF